MKIPPVADGPGETPAAPRRSWFGPLFQGWNRFWFQPADPTPLAFIRLCCGLLAVYTLVVYSYDLQEFMGARGWLDLDMRLDQVRKSLFFPTPLGWGESALLPPPVNAAQKNYVEQYRKRWNQVPPPPYPQTDAQAAEYDRLHEKWGVDPRAPSLPLPDHWQEEYVDKYKARWGALPPPPYPRDQEEADRIDAYRARWGVDPRIPHYTGVPHWSVWFHITDPATMLAVHWGITAVAFLFAIGFCTRLTSVLTWVAMISYAHRSPATLFGVDVMMNIVMLYLMIGPSGAALSVDRLLARWWAEARPRVLGRWRALRNRLFGRPELEPELKPGTPPPDLPEPGVTANVALRLLQIHVCFIYIAAGLSKLQGAMWWNGTAVWSTIANYEFAPMQYAWYVTGLRALSKNRFLLELFLTSGTFFTLIFEIGYAFLIWLRKTRWVMLGMAITLHGFIGLFMGLKTFSIMMLIMNSAFLTPAEVRWLLTPITWVLGRGRTPAPEAEPAVPAPHHVREDKATAVVTSGHTRRKK
jgi:hypothetical protein